MRAPSYRFAVFDLDGTLVDSRTAIVDAVAEGIREVLVRHGLDGLQPDPSTIRGSMGLPADLYYRAVLPDTLQELAGEVQAAATVHEVRALASGRGRLYPGVLDTLRSLRGDGVRLAIVSNAQLPYFRAALEHLELGAHCDHHECFDELPPGGGQGSSKQRLLARALEQLGAAPGRTIMVGDRREDLAAARALGCRPIGLGYGFGSAEELEGAEAVLTAFPEILGL